ncbi:MAG: BrnA antitoxin family protein [Spirochaetales bacterium]|nr:BrnA antitoxin family protein [Spirochaetales bacterium]MDY5914421.1 BrnA antitoxin family protein [Treponema sp.]
MPLQNHDQKISHIFELGKLKQQITIRLDELVIDYFKKMAEKTGMPYQNNINYYLLECIKEKKHIEVAFSA